MHAEENNISCQQQLLIIEKKYIMVTFVPQVCFIYLLCNLKTSKLEYNVYD